MFLAPSARTTAFTHLYASLFRMVQIHLSLLARRAAKSGQGVKPSDGMVSGAGITRGSLRNPEAADVKSASAQHKLLAVAIYEQEVMRLASATAPAAMQQPMLQPVVSTAEQLWQKQSSRKHQQQSEEYPGTGHRMHRQ